PRSPRSPSFLVLTTATTDIYTLSLHDALPTFDELYRRAWRKGLKTTYYLRSQGATHVEKSTLRGTDGRLNAVTPVAVSAPSPSPTPAPRPAAAPPRSAAGPAPDLTAEAAAFCAVDDPECEACQ